MMKPTVRRVASNGPLRFTRLRLSASPSSANNSRVALAPDEPPRSALVIVNPTAAGPVNVRNAYAAVVKKAFDVWGTYYGHGEVVIELPDDEETFRGSVGKWLEEYSCSRLGARGGRRPDGDLAAGDCLVQEEEVEASTTAATTAKSSSSPNNSNKKATAADKARAEELAMALGGSVAATLTKPSSSTSSSSAATTPPPLELPDLIVVFGGDGTVNSVVSMYHDLDKAQKQQALRRSAKTSNTAINAGSNTNHSSSTTTTGDSSASIFDTPILVMPAGMANGIAASMGTNPILSTDVFGSRIVGGNQIAKDFEDIFASQEAAEMLRASSGSGKRSGSSVRATNGSLYTPREAAAHKKLPLQKDRVVMRVPTYEVLIRPTEVLLARLREDARRTKLDAMRIGNRNRGAAPTDADANSGSSIVIDDETLNMHVGYCVGGMSAGLWANIVIKAHMLATLSEEYPGLPSIGSQSTSWGAMRELVRCEPVTASLVVSRRNPSNKNNGTTTTTTTTIELPHSNMTDLRTTRTIEGPLKMLNVAAMPLQGYGWALTPAAACGLGAGAANRWAAAAAANAANHRQPDIDPITGAFSGDRLVATVADATATKLRLAHLLFREARKNNNTSLVSSALAGGGAHTDGTFGVNTEKVLCEDGVHVYGSGGSCGSVSTDDDHDAAFHAKPYTVAGIRNDSSALPLIAMVDGTPVKVPPLCTLEMRPTGKTIPFWV